MSGKAAPCLQQLSQETCAKLAGLYADALSLPWPDPLDPSFFCEVAADRSGHLDFQLAWASSAVDGPLRLADFAAGRTPCAS